MKYSDVPGIIVSILTIDYWALIILLFRHHNFNVSFTLGNKQLAWPGLAANGPDIFWWRLTELMLDSMKSNVA